MSQDSNITVDDDGKMLAVVQAPPAGDLVHVRETGAAYPVEVLAKRRVEQGFELKINYLWEGRRREERVPAGGPAVVESDGLTPLSAEVVNVSSGGMQLFMDQPLKEGSTARVKGAKTEHLGLVRYCNKTPGGFRVGLQFYGGKAGKR